MLTLLFYTTHCSRSACSTLCYRWKSTNHFNGDSLLHCCAIPILEWGNWKFSNEGVGIQWKYSLFRSFSKKIFIHFLKIGFMVRKFTWLISKRFWTKFVYFFALFELEIWNLSTWNSFQTWNFNQLTWSSISNQVSVFPSHLSILEATFQTWFSSESCIHVKKEYEAAF